MELHNAITVLLMIFGVWVPQTQQTNQQKVDLSKEKIYIFQKKGESNSRYYKRILKKNYHESSVKLDVRVQCLKVLLPDLSVWDNDNYVNYVTVDEDINHLPTYKTEYLTPQGFWEHEEQYYDRIFEKQSDETLSEYMERIGVLKEKAPAYACWKKNDYMYYVKPYLEAYKKEAIKQRAVYVPPLSSEESETEEPTKDKKKDKNKDKKKDKKADKKKNEYERSKAETEEAYCMRIIKNLKDLDEKGFKEEINKLKRFLVVDEFKTVKKTCKNYTKAGGKKKE